MQCDAPPTPRQEGATPSAGTPPPTSLLPQPPHYTFISAASHTPQAQQAHARSYIRRRPRKLDTGTMVMLVTDLGSSGGTRYTPGKHGKKIAQNHLSPGGSLYLGAYIITYQLGVAPPRPKLKPRPKPQEDSTDSGGGGGGCCIVA